MTDFNHLDTLNLSLSKERERASSAASKGERDLRGVWVKQLEKEVAQERAILGLADSATDVLSDDDLLAGLSN